MAFIDLIFSGVFRALRMLAETKKNTRGVAKIIPPSPKTATPITTMPIAPEMEMALSLNDIKAITNENAAAVKICGKFKLDIRVGTSIRPI
jgi:hypothetical protein